MLFCSSTSGGRHATTHSVRNRRDDLGQPPATRGFDPSRRSGPYRPHSDRRLDAGAVPQPLGRGGASHRTSESSHGHLRAPDGHQTPHRMGLRDAGARGLRLPAPAALLSAGAPSPRAPRVDGPQAHPPAGIGPGRRLDPRPDHSEPAPAPLPAAPPTWSCRSAIPMHESSDAASPPNRTNSATSCSLPNSPPIPAAEPVA